MPLGTRDTKIWLIGGPSGAGKSRLAYPLARSMGVPLVEIDDIVEALLVMTTPKQQPAIHFWRTHPEAAEWSPERILEQHLSVAAALAPAVEAAIANHLETDTPVVIEGDYVLPEMATRERFQDQPANGRVRALFVVEDDEDQLIRNFGGREPGEAAQSKRAEVSRLLGEWLRREGDRLGVPVMDARPWATASERARSFLRDE